MVAARLDRGLQPAGAEPRAAQDRVQLPHVVDSLLVPVFTTRLRGTDAKIDTPRPPFGAARAAQDVLVAYIQRRALQQQPPEHAGAFEHRKQCRDSAVRRSADAG